ncbi:MAG: aspartate aminotransferase family protein [Phycisphaerae bacterium]|nr:aspartate aminotransferase family protein [Phycisphaerae bacterium]
MKFDRSKALMVRAAKVVPGGISSNVRANWFPHPMFYERGRGARVWDVDGNEFVDYVLARGPLLLGHSPKRVLDAVHKQIDTGLMYAGQCELAVQVAERICELVPCAEMVRFSNSGSEAVHAAWRLARAATGRRKIIRFEGHYHGWYDSQIWNTAPPLAAAGPREAPLPVPATKGQVASDAENMVVLPWNDLDLLRQTLESQGSEIAGLITEPIMCNQGGLMPRPGYLEGMRELCTKYGVVLIFDEVITGFRVALGGAQARFGVTPDLATFAKGMGGGFPVSALAGKREFMQLIGPGGVLHAGTYNSNPPCMAAALAALETLSADDGAALKGMAQRGRRLREGIRHRVPGVVIRGVDEIFHLSFGSDPDAGDYRDQLTRDTEKYRRFVLGLQEHGVRVVPDGIWFLTTALTDEDVDDTLAAVEKAAGAL